MTRYKFRGYTITNCGYHQPDHCVWWEAVDENGEACFHGHSLREVEFMILDDEWEKKLREKDAEIERLKPSSVGNAAAMSEALEGMCKASQEVFCSFARETFYGERRLDSLGVAFDKAKAALSAPPRNCDVGTAEEQKARMLEYCKSHKNVDGIIICERCPHHGPNWTWCALRWAQTPYEANEGGAE